MVNNGKLTRFWEDTWRGSTPLRIAFPRLFEISDNKTGRVCDFFKNDGWTLNFRRSLSQQELVQWGELIDQLEEVQLNSDQDTVKWELEKSGIYSTK